MKFLKKAVEMDSDSTVTAVYGSEFETLKEDPDFLRLIDQYKNQEEKLNL